MGYQKGQTHVDVQQAAVRSDPEPKGDSEQVERQLPLFGP